MKIKTFFFALSILILGVFMGLIFDKFNWYYIKLGPYAFESEGVVLSMIFFPAIIVLVSLILFFLKDEIFNSWLKFTKWYLPIAIILIVIFPSHAGFLSPDRETITWLSAALFLIISLLIIGWKSWRLRGR